MDLFDILFARKMGGGGADELIVTLASGQPYEIKSDSVTDVGNYAFYKNIQLASVDFPNAKRIGEWAFDGCRELKHVNLESATEIYYSAFSSCESLDSFVAPNVISIDNMALYCTESLKSVHFPRLKTLGQSAFANSAIEKADFDVLENIGSSAFFNCANLTAVIIRTTSAVCVASLNAFEQTQMLKGTGHIYVPASMYEYYRAVYEPNLDPGMFGILFRKIEDYPEICG